MKNGEKLNSLLEITTDVSYIKITLKYLKHKCVSQYYFNGAEKLSTFIPNGIVHFIYFAFYDFTFTVHTKRFVQLMI